MTFLVLDTATSRGLVALCDKTQVLIEKELLLGLGNSRVLEPTLQAMFQEVGITPKDLTFVAVGIGPGSYTGLRVGAASAKGLAFGLQIPLVGVSSLHLFAAPKDFFGKYLVAIDAKIGGVYLLENDTPSLVSVEEFMKKLAETPVVVTPAWEPLAKRLSGNNTPKVFETGPSAHKFLLKAKEKFDNKEYSLDGSLQLLYLRRTQAELEKLPNKGDFE
jgi:tRNA threonylcarbamoyl adenosine modification protein YeaZ